MVEFIKDPEFFYPNETLQYLDKITPFLEALFINFVIAYFAGEQSQENNNVLETVENESLMDDGDMLATPKGSLGVSDINLDLLRETAAFKEEDNELEEEAIHVIN